MKQVLIVAAFVAVGIIGAACGGGTPTPAVPEAPSASAPSTPAPPASAPDVKK